MLVVLYRRFVRLKGLIPLLAILASCSQPGVTPVQVSPETAKELMLRESPALQQVDMANKAVSYVEGTSEYDECVAFGDNEEDMFRRVVGSYTGFKTPERGTSDYRQVEACLSRDMRGKLSSLQWTPFTLTDGGSATSRWAGGYFIGVNESVIFELHSDVDKTGLVTSQDNWTRIECKKVVVVGERAVTLLQFAVEFRGLTILQR